MFVCNCNAIRLRDAAEAIEKGAKDWREVHARIGCAPSCGKCETELTEMISTEGLGEVKEMISSAHRNHQCNAPFRLSIS